ncbi:MAG TPA: haloacid dehalogenase [Anaerolineae bacterium]|nr:haloacid dehalogenase [Anaerolineae bacterium]HID84446.1 haloacid dehalogenase [Anaerolineales bacterium]HIQ09658.1 haloacid dehalogenase [Anaerolineaceae bacterium]
MKNLPAIAEQIHRDFEARTAARDRALALSRQLTRYCAHTVRAIHRNKREEAEALLEQARQVVQEIRTALAAYPDLFYAGYTQDALKEFAEASITLALITDGHLPTPDELGLESATYIRGLAETVGELRRHCLDVLRHGYSVEAERLLGYMDEIYTVLVTMDYPDAVTGGLRRLTDIARSLLERTRGDLTLTLRQDVLARQMKHLEAYLARGNGEQD